MTEKPCPDVYCVIITATSCPTDRGDRLKAVRLLLMCQLFCHCSIAMMLQACLLLQQLPLLQEVIHIPFSYSLLFFITFFIRARRGFPILSPCVRGTRGLPRRGLPFAVFFAWAGKFLHCFRGGAVGGGVNPYIFRIIISGIKRFKYKACDAR